LRFAAAAAVVAAAECKVKSEEFVILCRHTGGEGGAAHSDEEC
jgi:hypothetical protein